MKKFLWIVIVLSTQCFAQEEKDSLTLSGYLEIYYLYDFNKPKDHTRPDFIYSYNRSNEFNLNLGFIKGAYATDNVRANLALMTGTYANANLRNEPGVLKSIFEANAGVKLSKKKNLWIDAGIFASHIGFESAIGKDCWNLTRSILADNSPYYETGVKVSYTSSNEKWFLSGMIINGWQRIQMVEGNTLPSFGTQVTFKPTSSSTINYSSFIGTDKPDSARLMRYFNNLYGIFQFSDKVGLTVGMDYGVEEKDRDGNGVNIWYSPVVIFQYKATPKFSTALRIEYYSDEKGVIVQPIPKTEFQVTGISLNADYNIVANAVWRVEVRNFASRDDIFVHNNQPDNNSSTITTSLAVSF
jgi:hypothetical protein